MPKSPIPAAGGALSTEGQSRRRFFLFVGKAGAAAAATAACIGAPVQPDIDLHSAIEQITSLYDRINEISSSSIDPYDGAYVDLILAKRYAEANEFSKQTGHFAAGELVEELFLQADRLFEKLIATPAQTQAGRAAKVTALLRHVMQSKDQNWRGPSDDLHWDVALCRALLAEYAGMTEEEMANV